MLMPRLRQTICLAAALFATAACAEQNPAPAPTASAAAETAPVAQRARPQPAAQAYAWDTIAKGLQHPWALAFLPGGDFLVSERSGALRVVSPQGAVSNPIAGLPEIAVGGQGGLLDVVLDADFARNRRLYFCFSEPDVSRSRTALAQAQLSDDRRRVVQVQVLFRQNDSESGGRHFGCRIVLQGDVIYLGLGDRGSRSADAQNLASHIGKTVRLTRDGRAAADNPFAAQNGAAAEIWTYGHRNIQGMAGDKQGRIWAHEHGAQGGDEINLLQGGRNYGWPVITHGRDYGGGKIGEGISAKAGMEQPQYYWDPSIAPSGMTFVRSENPYGPDWADNLLVGALKFGYVARLRPTANGWQEEKIEVGERVRDVRQGPDGAVYVLTDSSNGKLLKLKP
ncbi:glucose/arabinose dehydrogenase [Neisseria sp. HSC-16F19]|nr:PQQ-dependent sugar dehydrogenase [Neisseria sp. HSC-16F19]MCP2040665.1 glucose/arabinose dehydrogenase [Neisseria sp. HSC-16F19]